MYRRVFPRVTAAVLVFCIASAAVGQYVIDWHTIDGGGHAFSTGGAYSLGGAIGQHDAGPAPLAMTGGAFQLLGGFWVAAAEVCSCPGDMNADGLRNGRDVQLFIDCFIASLGCGCAELDGAPGVTTGDLNAFVGNLLTGPDCP
jgi:hypothetical protein